MGKKANPAVIGAFVVAAVALAVAGLVVFGGGKFLRETQQWVLYFDESIKGLAIGAPVIFKGVKVGSVTAIRVVVDRETVTIRTPVFVEIESHRFTDAAGGKFKFEKGTPGAKLLIERGLRAQLEMQSFVTGQLAVALDFHPGTPVKLVGSEKDVDEFPTIPSTTEELTKTIEELPIKQLAESALDLVQSIDRVVDAPELMAAIQSVSDAARDIQTLVRDVDSQVGPVASSIKDALGEAGAALQQAQKTLSTVEGAAAENSTLHYQITNTLEELGRAARSVRVLAEYLGRHPEALVRGKGGSGGNER